MAKTEINLPENLQSPTRLQEIPVERLLAMASCQNFQEQINLNKLELTSDWINQYNHKTQASWQICLGTIANFQGQLHQLQAWRDLDNLGLAIFGFENPDQIILRLNLRDRRCDGTDEATSPYYLQTVGGLTPTQIPPRSKQLGATNWYYSNPDYDKPPIGMLGAEFSITASDPRSCLEPLLLKKAGKLTVDPRQLYQFIDDPFAQIPYNDVNEMSLNSWYQHWWQVVNRGLRGKSIPYPGQASQTGYKGFFQHVIKETGQTLRDLDYSHLCGVPTWRYVWGLNLYNGFLPENNGQHQQAVNFFNQQNEIELPSFSHKYLQKDKLGDLDNRHPLHSWFAILPFVLELDPEINPQVNLNREFATNFNETLECAKTVYCQNDNVITYPLRPGQNLWHYLKLES